MKTRSAIRLAVVLGVLLSLLACPRRILAEAQESSSGLAPTKLDAPAGAAVFAPAIDTDSRML